MLSVQCLGIGKGATNFLTGAPSTSYVIKSDDKPILLLDCGAGVGRSIFKHLGGVLPDHIYISHNHSDHTGDLPVYMAVSAAMKKKLTIYGHPQVLDIVKQHRLYEVTESGFSVEEAANWIPSGADDTIVLDQFSLKLLRSKHSNLCFGFVLSVDNQPLLGWPSDSHFEQPVYDAVSVAKHVIVHARDGGTHDHAALDEMDTYATTQDASFYVSHYEATDFEFTSDNIQLINTGDSIELI